MPGELANANEPLVLADGTKIDSTNGRVIKDKRVIEVPNRSKSQQIVAQAKLRLADVPAPPKQANAISTVLAYTLMGLSDMDIAIALNTTTERISNIRQSDVYDMLKKQLVDNVISSDRETVRGMLNEHAHEAAAKLVQYMDAEDERVGLQATRDILDRTGHRPADVVEHKHMHKVEELHIVHVKRDERRTEDPIVIDVDNEEIDNGNGSE